MADTIPLITNEDPIDISENLHGFVKIVLLGKTGSGKSATGNTILGRDIFVKDVSSVSVTKHCKKETEERFEQWITVIDTPGIFATSISNDHVITEIQRCLKASAADPHVFLLVIRLDRFTEEEEKTVTWIKENFGEEASISSMILFTHVDQLNGKPLEMFIKESTKIRRLIDSFGGRYHAFNNNNKENISHVKKLLEKINKLVKRNGKHLYTYKTFMSAQKNYSEIQEKKKTEEALNSVFGCIQRALKISWSYLEDRVDGLGLGTLILGTGGVLFTGTVGYTVFLAGFTMLALTWCRKRFQINNH